MPAFIIVILAAVAFIFWVIQLVSLMMMPDDAFPGRYDKPVWAAILLVLNALGAVLFVIWKLSRQTDRHAAAVAGRLDGMIRAAQRDTDAS